jgi:hypothetical protein
MSVEYAGVTYKFHIDKNEFISFVNIVSKPPCCDAIEYSGEIPTHNIKNFFNAAKNNRVKLLYLDDYLHQMKCTYEYETDTGLKKEHFEAETCDHLVKEQKKKHKAYYKLLKENSNLKARIAKLKTRLLSVQNEI